MKCTGIERGSCYAILRFSETSPCWHLQLHNHHKRDVLAMKSSLDRLVVEKEGLAYMTEQLQRQLYDMRDVEDKANAKLLEVKASCFGDRHCKTHPHNHHVIHSLSNIALTICQCINCKSQYNMLTVC
jgi:hypothetical protein